MLALKPGDAHYRAYVGPPRDYDLITAMVFNLLTCAGVRQEHRVLDIGCGSLRVGRVLIPYLAAGNYFGIEPNKWLVKDGIENEVGKDLIKIKQPTFSFKPSMTDFKSSLELDFAFAQSIFSHCGLDLIENWLRELHPHLKEEGALFATFLVGAEDFTGDGWVYPDCVEFKYETMSALAESCGYGLQVLDWPHPRQAWGLFFKSAFNPQLTSEGIVSWAKMMDARYPKL